MTTPVIIVPVGPDIVITVSVMSLVEVTVGADILTEGGYWTVESV